MKNNNLTYLQIRCSSCETGSCCRNSSSSPTRGDCTKLLPPKKKIKKNCELVMRIFQWQHKNQLSGFLLRLDSLRYILEKRNGALLYILPRLFNGSEGFSCLEQRGFVLPFLLWKFLSAIYKDRFRNCSSGLNIIWQEKKEKKNKKTKKQKEKKSLQGKKCCPTIKLHGDKNKYTMGTSKAEHVCFKGIN